MVWVAPDILLLLEGNDIDDRACKGVRATRSLGAVSRGTIGDGFVVSNFEFLTLVKPSEAQHNQGFDLPVEWLITQWVLSGLRVVSVAKGARTLSAIAPDLAED
jgi:hypothetical protein